ncbi:dihydrofolate reductase-like domain-containing protein [Syncephalis fuscata]|nr:dihydrofolate reductase-like domain-containing protein [Syncephalis fuscata]
MSPIDSTEARQAAAEDFIARYYSDDLKIRPSILPVNEAIKRPLITLTYAQSLDGKIAGQDRQQLVLSGAASMIMTHRLRTVHDAILVGIGTVIHDNPRLLARHLRSTELKAARQPQPIIIDTHLKMPLTARLLDPQLHKTGDCLPPWIIVGENCADPVKCQQVEARGAKIIYAPLVPNTNQIDLSSAMHLLSTLGIHRVMVEGGARLIRAFLTMHASLIDLLIITIAPVLVGDQGTSALGDTLIANSQVSIIIISIIIPNI